MQEADPWLVAQPLGAWSCAQKNVWVPPSANGGNDAASHRNVHYQQILFTCFFRSQNHQPRFFNHFHQRWKGRPLWNIHRNGGVLGAAWNILKHLETYIGSVSGYLKLMERHGKDVRSISTSKLINGWWFPRQLIPQTVGSPMTRESRSAAQVNRDMFGTCAFSQSNEDGHRRRFVKKLGMGEQERAAWGSRIAWLREP